MTMNWMCPSCHALVGAAAVERCFRCGADLSWIAERFIPEFVQSLKTPAAGVGIGGRSVSLSVELRWRGQASRVTGAVGQTLTIPLMGESVVVAPLNDAATPSVIVSFGKGESLALSLPGRSELPSGFELDVWHQVVETAAESRPGPILSQAVKRPACFLTPSGETTFGRGKRDKKIDHIVAGLDGLHFVVAQDSDGRFWIVDGPDPGVTFVNGRPILACRLHDGDLIYAGGFAWTLTAGRASTDRFLTSAEGIAGCRVEVNLLSIPERLNVRNLDFRSGRLTALVGPSGAGKSTLLKCLARLPGYDVPRDAVVYDGQIVNAVSRGQIGYLSQDAFIHESLTPEQILRFVALLRCADRSRAEPESLRSILADLALPSDRWSRPLSTLSGGEQRRVRIAAELVARPRVFFLDEPASGLDDANERLVMRLLRALSQRGCTVFLVTHGREAGTAAETAETKADPRSVSCDRVVRLVKGKVDKDRPAWDYSVTEPEAETTAKAVPPRPSARAQFISLLGREKSLIAADRSSRLAVPVFVAVLFGVALAIALPGEDRFDRLAFFAVLSAIWLGASLSLSAVVGERAVFDHESALYLRTLPYVAAKFIVYGFLGTLQGIVFFGALMAASKWVAGIVPQPLCEGWLMALAILVLLEVGGVCLGLFLSTFAGRSAVAAHLFLPLVMIVQIVFSAPVGGRDGAFVDAYRDSHFRSCAVWPTLWANRFVAIEGSNGIWLSEDAWHELRGATQIDDVRERIKHLEKNPVPAPRTSPPAWLTRTFHASISYCLFSRYGDTLFRCTVGSKGDDRKLFAYDAWSVDAALSIAALSLILLTLTVVVFKFPLGRLPF